MIYVTTILLALLAGATVALVVKLVAAAVFAIAERVGCK